MRCASTVTGKFPAAIPLVRVVGAATDVVTVGPNAPVNCATPKPPCTPVDEPYVGAMKPDIEYGFWKYWMLYPARNTVFSVARKERPIRGAMLFKSYRYEC